MRDQALKGDSAPTRTAGRWRAMAPLAGVAVCLLLAVVIINPFREMLSLDDGWAYVRSVEHLLRTGQYRLDAWAAANMPVQIYLAAGLSKIFGCIVRSWPSTSRGERATTSACRSVRSTKRLP